jgi:exodeoxyribonuclease-3
MPFSVATWNINSVRLRMPIVERLLLERAPDVLCLQETKCPDELFPFDRFHSLGYRHVEIHGQKGYHGVATVARRPIEAVERRQFCAMAARSWFTISMCRQAATSLIRRSTRSSGTSLVSFPK